MYACNGRKPMRILPDQKRPKEDKVTPLPPRYIDLFMFAHTLLQWLYQLYTEIHCEAKEMSKGNFKSTSDEIRSTRWVGSI